MAVTLKQLAAIVRGRVVGDESVTIKGARTFSEAGPGDITFLDDERNSRQLRGSTASAFLIGPHFRLPAGENSRPIPAIEVDDPRLAFSAIRGHLLNQLRILVVGDVMYDVFEHYSSTYRRELKSEFPGKWAYVNAEEIEALGGAGNVAANLASIGVKTSLIGVIGNDDQGEGVVKLSDRHLIEHVLVRSFERRTTWKMRIYVDGEFILRRDKEDSKDVPQELADSIAVAGRRKIPTCDAIILSDYNKGIFRSGTGLAQLLVNDAVRLGIPVVVDCKPANIREFRGATVVAPNELEATQLVPEFSADRRAGIRKLKTMLDVLYCVVTIGSDGLLCDDGDQIIHIPGERVAVKNPVGAGDTVRAFLAIGLAAGFSIKESLTLANAAAARVIQKDATATLSVAEVQQLLDTHTTTTRTPAIV